MSDRLHIVSAPAMSAVSWLGLAVRAVSLHWPTPTPTPTFAARGCLRQPRSRCHRDPRYRWRSASRERRPAGLERECPRLPAPGYAEGTYTLGRCLNVIISEECEHRRYAVRDLAVLEKDQTPAGTLRHGEVTPVGPRTNFRSQGTVGFTLCSAGRGWIALHRHGCLSEELAKVLLASGRAMTGWMVTAVLVTGLVSGCTSSGSQPERPVSVAVQPDSSLADQAVLIEISGLGAGELVDAQLSSTDAVGVPWQASAVYRADAGGDVDLGTAAAISGSYHGVSGMGLIWSMRALRPDPVGAYLWNGQRPLTFTLAVSAHGTQLASARFTRAFSPIPLTETMQSLRADGFVGQFWHPASTAARRPAVLVLGGSEGGLPGTLLPALLASNGYQALGVAYFGEPGLPQRCPGSRWNTSPGRCAGWPASPVLTRRVSPSWAYPAAARPRNCSACTTPNWSMPSSPQYPAMSPSAPILAAPARPGPCTAKRFPTPANSTTPAPPTPRPRSSRTSGSKARCSWTAARQTRHGAPARTPGPSSACSTPIMTAGHTCCTPTPAPDTRSANSSPTSPLPRHRP